MAYYKDKWATHSPEMVYLHSATLDKSDCKPNNNAVCEHYIVDRDPFDGVTIIFCYDGPSYGGEPLKDHAPDIFCRVVKYAESKCNGQVGQIYFLPYCTVKDDRENFEIMLDYIDYIFDEVEHASPKTKVVIINASRKAYEQEAIEPPSDYGDIEPLRVINRFEYFRFKGGEYPAVMTVPSRDVLHRNDYGKIGKENQMLVGEWFYATKAAVDGNLYDIKSDYTWEIVTEAKWDEFMDILWESKFVSIDTETDNLNRIVNKMACVQISCTPDHSYIIPFDHPDANITPKFRKRIIADLKEYFEWGKSKYHIYANAKFDLIQLFRELKLKWYNHICYDVAAGQQQLDENRKFRSSVKLVRRDEADRVKFLSGFSLEQIVIEHGCSAYVRTAMGKEDRANIFSTPFQAVAEYGGLDTVTTWRICVAQIAEARDRGEDYSQFVKVITGQINSMIRAFTKMELTGIPIDRVYLAKEQSLSTGTLQKARVEFREKMYQESDAVHEANRRLIEEEFGTDEDLFGRTDNWIFDIDKIEHQQMLFFDVMGLEPVEYGKNGTPSTNKFFKERYAPKEDGKFLETAVEDVKNFVQYGEHKFLHNTFIKAIYKFLTTNSDMRVDNRLRSNYIYLPIVTGRAGSNEPSLQNIPSRSKLAQVVKRQFITKPGSLYIKADFDAHEIRQWGVVSKEQRLADAFISSQNQKVQFRLRDSADVEDWEKFKKHIKQFDLHTANCKIFYGLEPEQVTKEIRTRVKTVAFGTVYGMSAIRLAKTLGISEEDAQNLQDMLFDKFPDGTGYIEITHKQGKQYLVCVSAIGRVRHMWGYLHLDRGIQSGMDRRGPNSLIQGLASDEGMEANYQLQKTIWENFHSQDIDFELELCNMVHDSTETISPIITAPVACYLIEHAGSTLVHKTYRERYGVEFNVGLELGFELGGSLGEMHDWNYRPEQLEKIVVDSAKWSTENLRHPPMTKNQLEAFRHNNDLMFELRRKELRQAPKNFVNELMLLDTSIARQIAVEA